MGASRRYLELDSRRRIALGRLARHDMYLVTVAADGVITLTPAAVTPLAAAPPVRKRRAPRKTAPAAAEPPEEQE